MSNHNNDDDFEITNEDLERLRFSCGFRRHAYNPQYDGSPQDYLNAENQRRENYINTQRNAHYNRINNVNNSNNNRGDGGGSS